MLAEVSAPPRLVLDTSRLLPEPLKSLVDQYVRTRTPATLPQVRGGRKGGERVTRVGHAIPPSAHNGHTFDVSPLLLLPWSW